MLVIMKEQFDSVSKEAAKFIADRLLKKPNLVLGLATGSTPIPLYRELIRLHRDEGLDFSKVTTFNLDEYVGLPRDHQQSYYRFMCENLFDHINVDRRFVNVPNGMVMDIEAHCDWYEQEIERVGGIDIQVLGIGGNGHIAFNEPGSSLGSRTRVKTLSTKTREDNARFFDSFDEVPRYAITMGIGTIMEARELVLLASGGGKAEAIRSSAEGPVTAMVPGSMVQMHRRVYLFVDRAAGSALTGEHTDSLQEAMMVRRPLGNR
ncbi:glucosamine-6-phosphate deaminase [soil metagenome]